MRAVIFGAVTFKADMTGSIFDLLGFIFVLSFPLMPTHLVFGLDSRKAFFIDDINTKQVASSKTVLLKTVHVPSELACAQKCFGNELCSYKSFDLLSGKCQLYKEISLEDLMNQRKVSQKRNAKDPCDTANCGSRCKCKSLLGTEEYACDCRVEGLSKTSKDYVHRSCNGALTSNGNVSGYYLIQPSLKFAPVSLKCERGTDGKGYTVFHHDTEAEVYVSGYPDSCGGYKKQFVYNESMETIILVINNSVSCKQHTKAVCKGVVFMANECSWLTGRNVKKIAYWGGGPHDGVGCSCGITGTCADSTTTCNCNLNNNNSDTFYQDEGDLKWKYDLPVTGIALGDTGRWSNEVVKYTIGPLKCIV